MARRQLWSTPDKRRVFLIPPDAVLPPGPDRIERPLGAGAQSVDLALMSQWEVEGKGPWAKASQGAPATPRPQGAKALREVAEAIASELRKPEVKAAIATLGAALTKAAKKADPTDG